MMIKSLKDLLRLYRQKKFMRQYNVGEFTYGVPQVLHWGEKSTLSIGKFCSISSGVIIFLGGEHHTEWISAYPFSEFFETAKGIRGHPYTKGDVCIGNDVWLGYGSCILSGVTIGDGAAVGAGAVVAKDVPPYAIVAGNPAKIVRYRFEPEVRDRLHAIKWWDWPIHKILDNVEMLMSDRVKEFMNIYGDQNNGKILLVRK